MNGPLLPFFINTRIEIENAAKSKKKAKTTKQDLVAEKKQREAAQIKKSHFYYFSQTQKFERFAARKKIFIIAMNNEWGILFDKPVFRLFCKQDQFSISCSRVKSNMCSQFARQKEGVFLFEKFRTNAKSVSTQKRGNVSL